MPFRFARFRPLIVLLALVAIGIAIGNFAANGGRWRAEVGNGTLDVGEECDWSALPNGCPMGEYCVGTYCIAEVACGDGIKDATETCDRFASPNGCSTGQWCDDSCQCKSPSCDDYHCEMSEREAFRITATDYYHPSLGGEGGNGFGQAIASIGDVDGDGVSDIAVGNHQNFQHDTTTTFGAVRIVFLNQDWSVKGRATIYPQDVSSDVRGDFGAGLAPLGDLNGDGVPDLAVSSGNGNSIWILFLKSDGTVKSVKKIAQTLCSFSIGSSVTGSIAPIGDLDGDGVADLAVVDSCTRIAILYLKSDGSVKSTAYVPEWETGVEYALGNLTGITLVGDLNGDGKKEIAVGRRRSPYFDYGSFQGNESVKGAFWILSLNSDGTVAASSKTVAWLPTVTWEDTIQYYFAAALAGIGDYNGDGIPDLLIGSPIESGLMDGRVDVVLLKADGTVLSSAVLPHVPATWGSDTFEYRTAFGVALAALPDRDGDGKKEIAIGDGTTYCGWGGIAGTVWLQPSNKFTYSNGLPTSYDAAKTCQTDCDRSNIGGACPSAACGNGWPEATGFSPIVGFIHDEDCGEPGLSCNASMQCRGCQCVVPGSTAASVSSSSYSSFSSSAASTPAGDMTWNAIGDMKCDSQSLRAVAYGAGKFVAAGQSGKGAYSTDGATWTAIGDMKFGTDTIYDVAYGAGKYVAVGTYGKGAYSMDGITWTAINNTSFGSSHIQSVTYGNGMFFATGENNKGAYSTNGVSWTAIDNLNFIRIGASEFAYSGDKAITLDSGNNGQGLYTSDGISWFPINDNAVKLGWIGISIAYGNGKFVAVAQNGAYSLNGTSGTWTGINDLKFGGGDIYGISYGDNRFVIVGHSGKGAYSIDGVTWTAVNDMKFGGTNIYDVAYGNGIYVAVGSFGKGAYSGTPIVVSSSSFSSYSASSSFSSSASVQTVCANGIIEVGEECEIGYACLAGDTCAFDCRCTSADASSQASSDVSTTSSFSSQQSSASSGVSVASSVPSVLCGNGVIEGSEACEASIPCPTGQYCSNCQCMTPDFCGDQVVDSTNDEECESDSDCPEGDFCTLNCLCHEDTGGNCGNGTMEAQEQCERNHPCGDDKQCQTCVCIDVPRCGNSALERGEQCEVNDACPAGSSCVNCLCQQSPGCGNGILGAGEQCEQDSNCAAGQYCNRLSCRCEGGSTGSCGNGILADQEQCELGQPCQNADEICDLSDCSCVLDLVTTLCGNAQVDAGEDCDIGTPCGEGQICNFSGCHCIPWEQRCGDAELSGGEECEIGSPCGDTTKACDISQCICANLSADEVCGNGLVEIGEECEVGTACPFGWSCDFPHCRCLNQPVCGDATLNAGEQCEINSACSGENQTCDFSRCRCAGNIVGCGNGVIDPGEQCDDGNRTDGDGCGSTCQREWQTMVGGTETCGNGIVESMEQCDDGNRVNGDGCSHLCQWETSAIPGLENPTWGVGDHAAGSQVEGGFLAQGGYTSEGVFISGGVRGPGGIQVQGSNRGAQTIVFPGQQGWNPAGGQQQQQQIFFPSYYGSAVPYAPAGGPVGSTGPAAVMVIAAGAAGGWAWMRRKRKDFPL